MANRKKEIRDEEGFIVLKPKPGGRYEEFLKERYKIKLPKDSNDYLYKLVDIYGSEDIQNMSIVDIGDYALKKGTIHALNMNVGRNIPWMDDGLKPVERRALFIMWRDGLWGKKTAKVSSIVGDMINYVYPHGDAAPAETIFRLGRSKSMMIPYIQELSNFGSVRDFKPAAPRYADASLSDYAYDCFFKEVGPKRPLYDEKDNYAYNGKEPIYLISRYPNILMQWDLGIGKGAMTQLCGFNSIDIFKTTLKLMDDPNADVHIYPDAPTPVEIVNKADLRDCFDMKTFKIKMVAPYYLEVDQRMNGTKIEDKYTIVFTALPVGVSGLQIRDELVKIKKEERNADKAFPEVLNLEIIADDSPGGIKIIVEYVRGYDPYVLVEKLYKSTSLCKTIGFKPNLVINNRPVICTPREILLSWISQRYDQKRRYYHQLVLQAAKDRTIYEALSTVLATRDATDKAIEIIRNSKDDEERIAGLRKAFGFTELQARVIGEMKLKNLQKMDVKETIAKRDKAIADYKHYRKILSDDSAIKDAVREELKEGMKKYGKPRTAKVINQKSEVRDPDDSKWVIYNSKMYYCVDHLSDLTKLKDRIDSTYQSVEIRNSDNVMIFEASGIVKFLTGYSFTNTTSGINTSTLGVTDPVRIIPAGKKENDTLLLITKMGYGKSLDLSEINSSIKCRVITLNSGDALADVIAYPSSYNPDSIVGMVDGDKMYYLHVTDFPRYKKSSAGNRMIKGVTNLNLSRALYFGATDDADYMLVYAESGYIKLLDMSFLAFAKRANNSISLHGKNIMGATLIHGVEDKIRLISPNVARTGSTTISIQIGKMVTFKNVNSGEQQKFKMSTTIGNPTKILKVTKDVWYRMDEQE